MTPTILPMIFVLTGIASAIIIFIDEYVLGNRQPMKIMNPVWVLTALWGGVVALLAYYTFGRKKKTAMTMKMPMSDMSMKMDMPNMNMTHNSRPKWQSTALSTLHCGAGCTLADLIGESFILFFPMAILSGWLLEYVLALLIGVVFQYAAIRAMDKKSSTSEVYQKAFRADFWSLTAWQIGMYGFLAAAIWLFGVELNRLSWQFWSLMQFAMVCGFLIAYPVNRLLIKNGIKKVM